MKAEIIRKLLRYDPFTGRLYWRKRSDIPLNVQSRINGRLAGHLCEADGYIHIRIQYRSYLAHRIVWLIVFGEWPSEIDHINGIRRDNRISNLRQVDRSSNMKNAKIRVNNITGIVGVHFHAKANKWQAGIKSQGVFHYLGLYGSFDEAVRVRKLAEIEHGFHANHGRIT